MVDIILESIDYLDEGRNGYVIPAFAGTGMTIL